MDNLRHVLADSPLPEEKALVRGLVKEVKVTGKQVLVVYAIPPL